MAEEGGACWHAGDHDGGIFLNNTTILSILLLHRSVKSDFADLRMSTLPEFHDVSELVTNLTLNARPSILAMQALNKPYQFVYAEGIIGE